MSEPVYEITLGRLYGWKYCAQCIPITKSFVLEFTKLNQTIPLHWLFANSEPQIQLSFFRNSKKNTQYQIQTANLQYFDLDSCAESYGCYMIQSIGSNFYVFLLFNDIETNLQMGRRVSLENIFAYNPWFYESLINCKNLLSNDKITIGFDDLDEQLKKSIHLANQIAQDSDKLSFMS